MLGGGEEIPPCWGGDRHVGGETQPYWGEERPPCWGETAPCWGARAVRRTARGGGTECRHLNAATTLRAVEPATRPQG